MRRVLVTGGTGSFGQAFVRKLLATDPPERLVVFSRGEHKQEAMARELQDHKCLRFFIGDVRDVDRLEMAMAGIDTVIHAAALKIIPIAEYNPFECIHTNVIGAQNVVQAAIKAKVKKVVALSTDKAVNPINLYGATKLCAEKVFVAANQLSAGDTIFAAVRYGNVIGSNGSVIPLFQNLLAQGKTELPITHEEMTRFWITLDAGVEFVRWAASEMIGGEIFVPQLPTMRIVDLAYALNPNVSLDIKGIRPGEKIHEVLCTEHEFMNARPYSDYAFVLHPWWHSVIRPMRRDAYTSDNQHNILSAERLRSLL